MRYSGTWLTPEDEAILEHLRAEGPATPGELAAAELIDYSEQYIGERCSKLTGQGQLVVFANGHYRISSRGEDYLDGKLDPDEVPTD